VLHSISKMYYSHWKPPGVSERMWSVNLDASISGVSDPRRAFLPAFRVTGSADDKPGSTWERRRQAWERRRQAWEHLGAPATNLGAPVTCLGVPRITVMYSVCILIYVSMYLYSYPSTHAISGLAAGGA